MKDEQSFRGFRVLERLIIRHKGRDFKAFHMIGRKADGEWDQLTFMGESPEDMDMSAPDVAAFFDEVMPVDQHLISA